MGTKVHFLTATSARPSFPNLAELPGFFRAIIEHTSDIITVIDGQGRLCYRSPSIEKILGYGVEEELGEPAFQHIHPEDLAALLPKIQERFGQSTTRAEADRAEVRVRHKDGSWRTLAVTSSSLLEFDGQIYLVTASHDVTQQKELEAEQSAQRYFAEALRDIAAQLNRTRSFEELLEQILTQVERVIPHTTANVALIQNQHLRFVRHRGYVQRGMGKLLDEAKWPIDELPKFKRLALTKGVSLITDTAQHPDWEVTPYNAWIRSYLSAAIEVQGQPTGLINLTSDKLNFFSEKNAQRLQAFAAQVAVAFESARFSAEYQEAMTREQQLNAVSRLLNSSLDLSTILQEVTRLAMALLGADGGIVGLIETEGELLRRVYTQGLPAELVTPLSFRDQGIAWEAVNQRRPVWVENYAAHPLAKPAVVAHGVRHVLCIPMLNGPICVGVLQLLFSQSNRRFTQRELDLSESVARQAAVAVANAHLFAETERRATELIALYRASEALLTTTNLKLLGQQIVEAAIVELTQVYCELFVLNEEKTGMYPIAESIPVDNYFREKLVPLKEASLVAKAAMRRAVVYVPDVRAEPAYLPINDWTRSELVIPLQVGANLIGVLNIESGHLDAFDDQRRRVLVAFAERAALALQSALLFEQVEETAGYTALLNEMTQLALQVNSFEELMQGLTNRLQRLHHADGSALLLLEATTGKIRYRAVSASVQDEHQLYRQLGQPLIFNEAVEQAGGTLVIEDTQLSPLIPPIYRTTIAGVRAILAVRLVEDERPAGFATIIFRKPRRFTAREIAQMQQAGQEISLAVAHRSLMQQMVDARQVAEDANRLKSEFLANTSHELRTPLTGIIGALELARDEADLTHAEGRTLIEAAYQASYNLMHVIDDLLDIAKIEAGKLQIDLHPTNMTLLLQEVMGLSRVLADKKELLLQLHLPTEPLPEAFVDPDRARQILLNLVGNAIKFTSEGQITVTASALPAERALCIQVYDTGIGVPADQQERLFQPFVQGDGSTARRYGGTGLGLSISRRLAELMKGSLTLYSAGLDQGSTLTLTLPLA